MQEFVVLLIVATAVWVVFRHMAPRSLRLHLNQVGMQIATILGWKSMTEKLAKKRRQMTGESGCTTCHGCSSQQQAGCEIRIPPEDIRKQS